MANINDFYNASDEDNRMASRSGQVEFLSTMRYIDKYLFPGARVLEIGAATGRYSHALAKRGYTIDALELVQKNIDEALCILLCFPFSIAQVPFSRSEQ